jgi:hypothetical protein
MSARVRDGSTPVEAERSRSGAFAKIRSWMRRVTGEVLQTAERTGRSPREVAHTLSRQIPPRERTR